MERKHDWAAQAFAEVLLRIIYFVIGFVAPVVALLLARGRGRWRFSDTLDAFMYTPSFLVLLLVCGVLCAAFGPYLYRIETQRGRGDLDAVRRMSQGRPKDENQNWND